MDTQQTTPPVYGRNAVEALLQSGAAVNTVMLAEGLQPKSAAYFTALAKNAGAVVKHVPAQKLATLCGPQHQGVAAFAAEIEYCSPDDIIAIAKAKNEPPFILLADGVEDPHNLGALLRSAMLCGVHGAIIPKRGSAWVSPAVIKSSAGAAALLPIARVANLGEAIRKLKKDNIFIYCADMQGTPLQKQDLSGPLGLVVGSEGRGVSPLIYKLCDGAISLPMVTSGGVNSFNVSVAGSILMHHVHLTRQG